MADDYAAARAKTVVVEAPRFQPRRNLAAMVLVATAVAPPGIQVPTANLTLTGFAPQVQQSTPVPRIYRATFVEPEIYQPPRNLAAARFVIGLSAPRINVPTGALTLTGFSPQVSQSGVDPPRIVRASIQIDATRVQVRRNTAAAYLSVVSAPQVGASIAVPPASLNLSGFAPLVIQATPILGGQDLQEVVQPEIWQPDRRSFLFALAQPGSQAINVPTGALTLSGLIPTVSVTGTVFVPPASLSLTGFAPTISQQPSGRIDVPLASLTINGFAPTIGVSGTIFLNPAQLTLTGYAPVISSNVASRPPRRRRVVISGPGRKLSE